MKIKQFEDIIKITIETASFLAVTATRHCERSEAISILTTKNNHE